MSGIGLERQPMREPLRAIGDIKQYLTDSSLQLLYSRAKVTSTCYARSDPWATTAALGDGKIHGPSLGGGIYIYKVVALTVKMFVRS
jgi:hypothetical protein